MILGANGAPIQSQQAHDADAERVAEIVKKVFALLQENQVPYNDAAAVGVNLILFFVSQFPFNEAEKVARHMMEGLHGHLQSLLREKLSQQTTIQNIVAANEQKLPS